MKKIDFMEGLMKYDLLPKEKKQEVDQAVTLAKIQFMPGHAELRRRIIEKYDEYKKIQEMNPNDKDNNYVCGVFKRMDRLSSGKVFPDMFGNKDAIRLRTCKRISNRNV